MGGAVRALVTGKNLTVKCVSSFHEGMLVPTPLLFLGLNRLKLRDVEMEDLRGMVRIISIW